MSGSRAEAASFASAGVIEAGELAVESGHELQVVCQRPELGRAAQLELHPLVHIEWLVEVVDLNAQHVAVWATLEERQTVDDPPRIALGQHALRAQPVGLDEIGILQGPEQAECGFLERHIHAGVNGDIEPVQLIEAGHPQHLSQLLTHDTGSSLASHECSAGGRQLDRRTGGERRRLVAGGRDRGLRPSRANSCTP